MAGTRILGQFAGAARRSAASGAASAASAARAAGQAAASAASAARAAGKAGASAAAYAAPQLRALNNSRAAKISGGGRGRTRGCHWLCRSIE